MRVSHLLFTLFPAGFIKGRIECIEVLFVQLISSETETFTESLIMHDFPFTKELYYITHIGVVNKAEDVIIGCSRLLLCRHILVEVGDDVALALKISRSKGYARRT